MNFFMLYLDWHFFSIGSDNSLLPSGNKLLPEPMLNKIYDATLCN